MACRDLMAKHRWALSGTPIQNSIQELYPYFKFLRVKFTGSYKVFCQNFVGTDKVPSKLGVTRLNQLLGRFMIRRTHADKVMGLPIVTLPKASEQIRWVKFNDVECSIYEIVRARMIKRINKLSRSKELDANYSHVLTMLLRLRQLTGHILTVEAAMRDLLEEEDHQKIFDLAELEADDVKNGIRSKQLRRVRALLAKGEKDDNRNHPSRTRFPGVKDKNRFGRRDSANTTENDEHMEYEDIVAGLSDPQNIGGLHGLQYDFTKYLKTLREGKDLEALKIRTTCCVCGDMPQDARITTCYHVYCQECLEQIMMEAADMNQGVRCKECGVIFDGTHSAEDRMDFDAADKKRKSRKGYDAAEESDSDVEMRKTGRGWKTRQEKEQREPDWIDMEGKNILPSAKTIEIKAQVLNWIAENQDVKIIIFTQFINMIRILEKVCSAEGWPYTLYHGGINMQQRQKNIAKFQDNPAIKILLSSLKAGGIGLNLTMAQKVIVVDPWWNSSVEQQAFCRVFRIGQEHETSLTRFVVENTVDQNMIEMQQRKQEEIDQVMDSKKKVNAR
jgi:SNF2 family DNA or RNA helicase